MNSFVLVAALVAVLCVTVNAGGFGDGFPITGGFSFGWGEDGGEGYAEECVCVNGRTGNRARRNTCYGNTGTAAPKGCRGTNQYKQCVDATCTVTNCTTGQVWNAMQGKCAVCPDGEHVRADLLVCVCNEGFKRNHTTGKCDIPCPTNANILPDSCKCPTAIPLIFHSAGGSSECRACPAGSSKEFGSCTCSKNPTTGNEMYWQASTWTCVACPGTPVNETYHRHWSIQICNSTGANQIFDIVAVSCFTCPAGTTADDNYCKCPVRDQKFNMKSGACECDEGDIYNPTTKTCVEVPIVPPAGGVPPTVATNPPAPSSSAAAGGNP